jgi:hypothetical protein
MVLLIFCKKKKKIFQKFLSKNKNIFFSQEKIYSTLKSKFLILRIQNLIILIKSFIQNEKPKYSPALYLDVTNYFSLFLNNEMHRLINQNNTKSPAQTFFSFISKN